MNRWIAGLVFLISCFFIHSSLALASEAKSCTKNDPEDCRQTVKAGEVVPFDGQLMTPRRASRLAVMAGQCRLKIDTAVEEMKMLLGLDLKLEQQMRANDNDHAKREIELLTRRLEEVQPSWYEHPALWMVIGGIIVGAVIGAAAAILDATRPSVVTVPIAP